MTDAEQPAVATRSTLSRQWVVRMVLITTVLIAFGGWGYYDATVAYPERGRNVAESLELEYLRQARLAGRLFNVDVFDPAGELETLRDKDVLELSALERAKLDWLEALAVPGLGMLSPEHTRFEDAQGELARLEEKFSTTTAKKPLSTYDIFFQWVICFVCWAIALYLIVLMLRTKARVYRWDPDARALTMPGGATVSAADLDREDPVDLSKWGKYLVFLRPRPGHETFKSPLRFDVFRHAHVEDWVRSLAKEVDPEIEFPDEVKARLKAEEEAQRAAEGAQSQEVQPEEGRPQEDGSRAEEPAPADEERPEARDQNRANPAS